MTRSDLVDRLHGRFRILLHDDAKSAVSVVLDALMATLAAGDRAEIRGFGSFEPVLRKSWVPGSAEGDRFEVLITLVEAYEAKHYPIELPDPVEAIKFRMEQAGLTPKDLVPFIGRLNRVYEVLNRKRPLTLNMIWRLHQKLGIPAECLIQPPKLPLAA